MWRLVGFVTLIPKKFETVVDQRKIEKKPIAGKTITSMANNLYSPFGIIAIDSS